MCLLAQWAGFPGFWVITNIHPEACAGLPVAEEVAALEFYLFTLPTSFLPLEMAPSGRSSWTRK